MSYSALTDYALKQAVETAVAYAVCDELSRACPVDLVTASTICAKFGVYHRVNVTRCGQDISSSRINMTTDKNNMVISLYVG